MLHLDNTTDSIHVYSGRPDLVNWTIEISAVKGRETELISSGLTIDFFGNSFYKLLIDTIPTLENKEYSYIVKAGNEAIKNGILRYGPI